MKHADAAVSASGTQLAQWQEQWAEAMSAIHLARDAREAEATGGDGEVRLSDLYDAIHLQLTPQGLYPSVRPFHIHRPTVSIALI
jgi:hypothetical protein